jgi:hypothetical protein
MERVLLLLLLLQVASLIFVFGVLMQVLGCLTLHPRWLSWRSDARTNGSSPEPPLLPAASGASVTQVILWAFLWISAELDNKRVPRGI